MKKLNILKTILDVFWFFSIIGSVTISIFLTMYLFETNPDIAIEIRGLKILNHNAFTKTIVVIYTISGLVFLYSIYLLRKVIILFQKREIFNTEVSRLLDVIGITILVSSILSNLSIFAYKSVERNHLGVSLDFGGFDSFLISISLGLFFMIISEVFKIAKNIKEENDLTI